MKVEPQKEHQWLQKLVGEWTYEADVPVKCGGTQSVRSLDGVWIIGESKGEMPGGAVATMIITLGYDPARKAFVGTWIGSMMTNLWVYDGKLDATETILTLDCEGPAMDGSAKLDKYQDIIEVVNAGHWILRAQVLGEDGAWKPFMTTHYRRKA